MEHPTAPSTSATAPAVVAVATTVASSLLAAALVGVLAGVAGASAGGAVLVALATAVALYHAARRGAGAAGRAAPGAPAAAASADLVGERARAVLDSLREGVVVVDDDGRIVLANPAAWRATRAAALDPTGRLLWEALVPELAELARDAWRALREQPRSPEELPQIRYAGVPCRDVVYDLTAVDATAPRNGRRFGTVFLLVDATRTFELRRLKDRFLSSVSHELRTPLTNICAYAELLEGMRPGEAAEWPEFVKVIHEEGVQLSRLVDGMFDYLQLESGEASFANEAVDGGEIVQRVCGGFAATARLRRFDFAVTIAADTPALVADRRRVEQVVRNLIDNAVKFTPDGGHVRVTLGARDEGWELRVEDSGPGVPPRERTAVFEKFSQLRDHLTDKLPGAGLGLATSRAIVGCLGGLIWCEDSPLGGAAFVVLLPGVGQPRLATWGASHGGAF